MFHPKRWLSAGAVVLALMVVTITVNCGKTNTEKIEEEKVEIYSSILAEQDKKAAPSLYYPKGIKRDTLDALFAKKNASAGSGLKPEDIYEVGENILITKDDLKQYETFYKLAGSTEAEKLGAAYAKEQGALYAEAMKQGFTVTDQEISDYLDALKANLETENKELYEHALQGFDSEEDYWDFEYKVYQVELPIQKYVQNLETEFMKESVWETTEEGEEAWNKQFEKIKKELVKKQNFRKLEM